MLFEKTTFSSLPLFLKAFSPIFLTGTPAALSGRVTVVSVPEYPVISEYVT